MTKLILMTTLLCIAYTHSTFAQVRGSNNLDKVYSEVLSEDKEILIHLPTSYKLDSKAKYPVMYLTDGLRNFNHAAGTLDLLTQSYKAQEMIIVAIKNTHRTRTIRQPTMKAITSGEYLAVPIPFWIFLRKS